MLIAPEYAHTVQENETEDGGQGVISTFWMWIGTYSVQLQHMGMCQFTHCHGELRSR